MPKLGDSRTMEGPGAIPAQDHRPDIEVEKRAARVAVRVIDLDDSDIARYHVDDETLRGDIQGLSVWTLDDRNTAPRPCVMWRHAWPTMVEEFGDAFLEEPPPPDAFPSFPSTPGGGGGGSWTPGSGDGALKMDPRQRIGAIDTSGNGGLFGPPGWAAP